MMTNQLTDLQLHQYLKSPEGARMVALSEKLYKSLVSDGMDKQIVGRILEANLLTSAANQESIEEFSPTLSLIKQSIITSHYYEESREAAFQRAGATFTLAREKIENQQNSHPLVPQSSVTFQQLHQYLESPEGDRKAGHLKRMHKSLVSGGMDEQVVGRILEANLVASYTKQESIEEFGKNLYLIEQSLIASHYYEESREEAFQRVGKTFNFVIDKIEERSPEMETEPVTDSYSYSVAEADIEPETEPETEAELETNNEAEAELGLPEPVTEADDLQIISEPVLPDQVFEYHDPLTGSEPARFEGVRETFDPLTNPNPISEGTVSEFIEPVGSSISESAGTVIEPIDGLQGFVTDGSAEFSDEQLQADLVNSMAASTEVLA